MSRLKVQLTKLVPPLLAALLCLALAVFILAALGHSPTDVLATVWGKVLWRNDPQLRLQSWANILQYATPLLLTGLAIAVAFRASVWNIGAQGQYLIGALAANAVGAYLVAPAGVVIPVLLLASVLAGALVAAIAGVLEWYRRVPVVLSTLLLNSVVVEFMRYLIVGPMHDPGPLVRSRELLTAAYLPFFPGTKLHCGFLIAVFTGALIAFILRYSTFGFRLRIVGANPVAARFAGIHVPRVALASIALSGALAGLAGGVEIGGVRHELVFSDADSAYGFTGIAVALLARLSPAGVVASAIFFGVLNACFSALQAELRVPYVTGQAVQGLIVIVMLVLTHPLTARYVLRVLQRVRGHSIV
jgi:simple sugar transport system permease protein